MVQEEDIEDILSRSKTIAVIGLSRSPGKDSYRVAQYLQSQGYRIVPVNPSAEEILGERSYPSLQDLPDNLKRSVDVVDIFRPSEDVPPIVDQAVEVQRRLGRPSVIWMQLGIVNEAAAHRALAAGLKVVMNRCMEIEHRRRSSK
ncbi:MAG: CoA-binding protein [Thaumarchaeota archaeon]|nr:CoA-binding protein [Nitrososphaerota archaeon]MCL5318180.1 CoA-binding protein [Nitrososphaerota archaeon]